MRTKLVLCAAVLAAGVATSMAQSNVYSLNVVGYVSKTINGAAPGKFSMIANPLNTTNNTLNNLINGPQVPIGANFYRWNGSGFDIATYFGSWDNDYSLPPGEGGFFLTDTTFTNTFVGDVMQGNLTNSFPAGFSIKASQVPQAGDLDALGLSAALQPADTIYLWNYGAQSFVIYTYFGSPGAWDPSPPAVGVGDAFFINASQAGKWVRNFVVGP